MVLPLDVKLTTGNLLANILALLNIIKFAHAYPLTHLTKRNISIESAQDDWSSLIAGIAPLVLLVGERITKQHLRESSSRFDYYILAATPLGLVTSVVSLLRLVSLPIVIRLIGRTDELLQDACKEITPVNTGSVHSILEEGKVQRGVPATQKGATGISTDVVSRLHFWKFRTTIAELSAESKRIRHTLQKLDQAYRHSADPTIPTHNALIVGQFENERPWFEVLPDIKQIYGINGPKDEKVEQIKGTLSIKVTAVGGEVNYVQGEVRSDTSKIFLVITSIVFMFTIHIAALYDNNWQVTLSWVFVVTGYIGLLLSVCVYAEAIKHRIDTTPVELGPHVPEGGTFCALQNGNLDQEGKTGYYLPVGRLGGVDVVRISTLRHPSAYAQLLGTVAGMAFVASFLLHYLGLRSVQWWVSICELAVCFIMVGVRALLARQPIAFLPSRSSFDFDLRSIGVITPQAQKTATVVDTDTPSQTFACVRLFLGTRYMDVKTEGDTVAGILASSLIQMDNTSRQRIFDTVGLKNCQMIKIPGSTNCVIIHCGGTGLLTTEGFVRPLKPLVWSTEFTLTQLEEESLIGWVAHGMTRNEELYLLRQFKGLTKEAVHIPATNMIVDWWLRSEGSNNWEFNARNLQWSGALALALVLSMAFCDQTLDSDIRPSLVKLIQNAALNPTLTARNVAEDLRNSLEKFAAQPQSNVKCQVFADL